MPDLDEKDLQILEMLQKNAQVTYQELADHIKVSRATIHNRIKDLEKRGIIKRYIPLLDPSKLGLDITALILVQVSGGKLVEVEKKIAKHPNVTLVLDITGEFDVALVCHFKNSDALSRFVKYLLSIPHVHRTTSSIALNIVKMDPRLNLPR
ncbi:MAG: Lrp/AsnC family transcriptional regulator [Candidatus Ranarchaeia archaeon]